METRTLDWAIRNFLAELLMPPGIWLLSVAIILFLFKKLQPFQKSSIFLFLGLIWFSATPIFTHALITISQSWMNWPQAFHLKDNNQLMSEQGVAIIVLGGGRRKGALESPEYHFQDLQKASMERLRVGAKLAHQTHLPILVSGGSPDQTHQSDWSEAKVMAKILENEFNLQPKWVEGKSHTTLENAHTAAST